MIRSALRVLRETHGPKTASSFGPLALKACQSDLVAKGLTRPGVNKRILLIRQFFRWASANEFIPPEIYHGLKSVDALRKDRTTAPEPEPIGPISDAAVEAVMPHVGPEVAAMVRLQLWSGMRPQEVCGMRPRDLTMVGDVWECRPRHKNEHHGKSRVVMFGPKCQELIKRFLGPDLDAPIFGRLTSSYRRAIHRGCDRAGIPRWSPNRLRHACGTNVRREFGLEAGRVVLGHAKVETTEIYAERDQDKAREIMRRMGPTLMLTIGGLLVSVAEDALSNVMFLLRGSAFNGAVVGRVVEGAPGKVMTPPVVMQHPSGERAVFFMHAS